MKYSGINFNDFSAAPGVSVTVFVQGCPHHCPGCHNPGTWDFDKGIPFTEGTLIEIVKSLNSNGVKRNLCIMGGEPLCAENIPLTKTLIDATKEAYPETKIYIWTGYEYKDVCYLTDILSKADYLIDGPFILEERDITLKMRGSRNQRIINLKTLTIEE